MSHPIHLPAENQGRVGFFVGSFLDQASRHGGGIGGASGAMPAKSAASAKDTDGTITPWGGAMTKSATGIISRSILAESCEGEVSGDLSSFSVCLADSIFLQSEQGFSPLKVS